MSWREFLLKDKPTIVVDKIPLKNLAVLYNNFATDKDLEKFFNEVLLRKMSESASASESLKTLQPNLFLNKVFELFQTHVGLLAYTHCIDIMPHSKGFWVRDSIVVHHMNTPIPFGSRDSEVALITGRGVIDVDFTKPLDFKLKAGFLEFLNQELKKALSTKLWASMTKKVPQNCSQAMTYMDYAIIIQRIRRMGFRDNIDEIEKGTLIERCDQFYSATRKLYNSEGTFVLDRRKLEIAKVVREGDTLINLLLENIREPDKAQVTSPTSSPSSPANN